MADRSLFSFPKKIFIISSKNFYQGTLQFKLLDSHQIGLARICYIFEINGQLLVGIQKIWNDCE
jgi:hypothetical protein